MSHHYSDIACIYAYIYIFPRTIVKQGNHGALILSFIDAYTYLPAFTIVHTLVFGLSKQLY